MTNHIKAAKTTEIEEATGHDPWRVRRENFWNNNCDLLIAQKLQNVINEKRKSEIPLQHHLPKVSTFLPLPPAPSGVETAYRDISLRGFSINNHEVSTQWYLTAEARPYISHLLEEKGKFSASATLIFKWV